MICIICLSIVSHALFRSVFYKSESCEGVSDYRWSIWIIVISQSITVLVGSLATIVRCNTIVSDPQLYSGGNINVDIEWFSFRFLTKKRELRKVSMVILSCFLVKVVMTFICFVILWVLGPPIFLARVVCSTIMRGLHRCCPARTRTNAMVVSEEWEAKLRDVFHTKKKFPKWIMRICVDELNKWMDVSKKNPPMYLVQLLSIPLHPSQSLVNILQEIGMSTNRHYKLSCLSLVILVRIVSLSIPSALARPIIQASYEAFDVVYYIDKKIIVGTYEDQVKNRFARVLFAYMDAHLSRKKNFVHSNWSVNDALLCIERECEAFPEGLAAREMHIVKDFIRRREGNYGSILELYGYLELLFVDMLLFFLPQLPIAILKEVNESPIEVHEERARSVLKLLYKLELLEDRIEWSFPEGCQVTRLMDFEGKNSNDQAGNSAHPNLAP
ncbi:hypothetical protein Sjap_005113 [Stephania japonica]|uniref:Uncharacterized protein n=1 Tax=Stephania japonica TaxID=461633 RepID=A0AAP0PKU5_9MAGN